MSYKSELSNRTRKQLVGLIESSGMTKADFAKKAGVSKQNLNAFRVNGNPLNLKTVENLASALDLETELTFKPKVK